ncbi:hypothetical protein Tco_0529679 [Tanacetum coccineum]
MRVSFSAIVMFTLVNIGTKAFLKFDELQCPTFKKVDSHRKVTQPLARDGQGCSEPAAWFNSRYPSYLSIQTNSGLSAVRHSMCQNGFTKDELHQMTSVHISSGIVLHQMTSDHNRSELGIQDHNNE